MMRRMFRRERGQALVEFSLVAIVFFIIVLGMIEVGRAVWNYNTLAEATREGARYAIVHGSQSTPQSGPSPSSCTTPNNDTNVTATVRQFASGLATSSLTVYSCWPDASPTPANLAGNRVTVRSQYQFTPFLRLLGGLTFTMTSTSTMEIAH